MPDGAGAARLDEPGDRRFADGIVANAPQ